MLNLRPLLILALLSISAIHCKDEANSTQGNDTSPVGMSINGETESPVEATTLSDDPKTLPQNMSTPEPPKPTPPTTSPTPPITVPTGPTPPPTVPTTPPTAPTTPPTAPTTPPTVPTTPPTVPTPPPTVPTKTTVPTPITTAKPIVPTTETPEPHKDRHFDGASFIGGIILAVGLMGIGFIAFKFYKARTERNYHTL